MSAAPRGLSRPHASFIGTVCQGIHHCALHNNPPPARRPMATAAANTQRKTQQLVSNWNTRLSDHHTHQPHPTRGMADTKQTNEHTHPTKGARPGRTTHHNDGRCASVHSQYEHQPHPRRDMAAARVHSPVLKPPPHHEPRTTPTGTARNPRARNHPPHQGAWRSGDPTACTAPPPAPHRAEGLRSLPHQQGRPPPRQGRKRIVPQTDATRAPRKNSVERR